MENVWEVSGKFLEGTFDALAALGFPGVAWKVSDAILASKDILDYYYINKKLYSENDFVLCKWKKMLPGNISAHIFYMKVFDNDIELLYKTWKENAGG